MTISFNHQAAAGKHEPGARLMSSCDADLLHVQRLAKIHLWLLPILPACRDA